MAKIDQAEFKRVVSAINDPQAPRPAGLLRRPPISKTRRAADKMFESVLTKAGLDVGKLGEMLAQDQGEVRGALQKQMASTDFSAAAAAYRQGIAARAKAIGLLKEPYTSTLVMLDTAFAIWELPHPEFNIFIGSDTGPMNNWIKVFVNEIAGNNATQFMFYFVWQNTSDTDVVINAASVLAPGGYCEIAAAPGFLSGDHSWLGIYANFRTIRWSGWGTDPMTGQNADQTPYPGFQQSQLQAIAGLSAWGGSYFGSGRDVETHPPFVFQNFEVSQNQILVPARAVAVFEVSFNLSYGFNTGGDTADWVYADFSTNANAVFCPFVLLEQLSP